LVSRIGVNFLTFFAAGWAVATGVFERGLRPTAGAGGTFSDLRESGRTRLEGADSRSGEAARFFEFFEATLLFGLGATGSATALEAGLVDGALEDLRGGISNVQIK